MRPSTVAGTSTRRPRAFGVVRTFPALDVSTTGWVAATPKAVVEGGGGLVGTLPADGDPGHGGAPGHAVTEPDGRQGVDRHDGEQRPGHHERPPARAGRGLVPVDLVGQGVEAHAMLP